jgi:hypothetical protein
MKHGFYSKRLRGLPIEEARQMKDNLDEEEALQRAFLVDYAIKGEKVKTLKEKKELLEVVGQALVRLAYLERTNRALKEQMDASNMPEVILEVIADMALARRNRVAEERRLDERVEAGDLALTG